MQWRVQPWLDILWLYWGSNKAVIYWRSDATGCIPVLLDANRTVLPFESSMLNYDAFIVRLKSWQRPVCTAQI